MIETPFRKTVIGLAVILSLTFLFGPNASAQRIDSGGEVRIVVSLIEASNDAPRVDPQIRGLVKQFRGDFRYSSYKLVSRIPKTIKIGSYETVRLPGSREMRLYARGYENNRVKLNVKVTERGRRGRGREVLNTDFRIVRGGTIMIGGYRYRDGRLMVAISADR